MNVSLSIYPSVRSNSDTGVTSHLLFEALPPGLPRSSSPSVSFQSGRRSMPPRAASLLRLLLRFFGGPADDRVDRRSSPTAAVVVVADATTTAGGGAAEANVAADDETDRGIGITQGKNAGGRRSFLLVCVKNKFIIVAFSADCRVWEALGPL